jgi:glycosyltransferase involved in cell wall biosynthesis
MAMELPTVAFDVPVSREFLGDLGMLAEPRNPTSLADAIQSLLSDPTQAKELGRKSRQRAAEMYSWEKAGQDILSIYDKLCPSRKGQRSRDVHALKVAQPSAEHQEGEGL